MKSPQETEAVRGPADETLRLIASLPAPDGFADRVQERLRLAPPPARILGWPSVRPTVAWMHGSFARSAAAAAIVCVVAGGGWRIYSRIQPAPNNVIVMPARMAPESRGFSSAGAARKPQTLDGPVLTHRVKEQSAEVVPLPVAPRGLSAHKKKAAKAVILPRQ